MDRRNFLGALGAMVPVGLLAPIGIAPGREVFSDDGRPAEKVLPICSGTSDLDPFQEWSSGSAHFCYSHIGPDGLPNTPDCKYKKYWKVSDGTMYALRKSGVQHYRPTWEVRAGHNCREDEDVDALIISYLSLYPEDGPEPWMRRRMPEWAIHRGTYRAA